MTGVGVVIEVCWNRSRNDSMIESLKLESLQDCCETALCKLHYVYYCITKIHVNNESWLLIIAKKKNTIQYLHEVHFNLSVITRSCSVILACPLNGHRLFGKPFIR